MPGPPPSSREQLRSASPPDLPRIIPALNPPSPSRRLSQTATLASVAAHRGTDARRLTANVHGDLDWVLLKAIEKICAQRRVESEAAAKDR